MTTESEWYEKYESQCHYVDGLEAEILILKSTIDRMKHGPISEERPWDRAPDRTSVLVTRSGREIHTADFVEGERLVSISLYPDAPSEMCLEHFRKHLGWFCGLGDIFSTACEESRLQAWRWLCGGPPPDRKLSAAEREVF